jgi:predicted outer membrane repeat protein
MAKERRRRKSLITGVAVTAGGMLGITQPALADTFQVNASDDSGDGVCQDVAAGDCTLRDAVIESNDNTGVFDDITFASSITGVALGGTQLDVTEGVYIQGNSPDATTISGGDASRLFNLEPGASEPVAFRDLTLTGGAAGGGYGGAIYNQDASLEITRSVLTGNSANKGGAIHDVGPSGENIEITDSTINDNTAADDGGAIFAGGSAGHIFNSTISGNHAGATGDDYGGGLFISDDSYIYDSTIAGNSAGYGGGVYVQGGDMAFVYNTIVGGNTATAPGGNFPPGQDVYGQVTAAFSLIQTIDDGTTLTEDPAGSNLIGSDPQLGTLQDNGGTTPTQKPALSSPVIDKGLSDSSVDQRGSSRPFDVTSIANGPGGDASDIGAVELQASDFPAPPGGGSTQAPEASVTVTGQRAAALKKCKQRAKKKHWAKKRLKKCKKKARGLPA